MVHAAMPYKIHGINNCIHYKNTVQGKYLAEEKLANLANCKLYLPIFSLLVFADTPKMYLAYALTVIYLPNFSLYGSPKISPTKYFLCMVNVLSCGKYLFFHKNTS